MTSTFSNNYAFHFDIYQHIYTIIIDKQTSVYHAKKEIAISSREHTIAVNTHILFFRSTKYRYNTNTYIQINSPIYDYETLLFDQNKPKLDATMFARQSPTLPF
jgi:hypothetical protein